MKKFGIGLLICLVYIDMLAIIFVMLAIMLVMSFFIIPLGAEVMNEFHNFSNNLTKIIDKKYIELKQEWRNL